MHCFCIILQYASHIDFNLKQLSNRPTYLNLKTKIYTRINTGKQNQHFMELKTFVSVTGSFSP